METSNSRQMTQIRLQKSYWYVLLVTFPHAFGLNDYRCITHAAILEQGWLWSRTGWPHVKVDRLQATNSNISGVNSENNTAIWP